MTVHAFPCPTCSGPTRVTVGMVCQTCGTDYAPGDHGQQQAAEPNAEVIAYLAEVRADENVRHDRLVADLQRLATAFEEEGIDPALPARLRAVLDTHRD